MITVLSAPTSLGLRPPAGGGVPGTLKAPEALRAAGLLDRLRAHGAVDGGEVAPGAYLDDDLVRIAGHVRNETQIVDHARRLSRRIAEVIRAAHAPLVIGGDCSILLAAGLALAPDRAQEPARDHGLIHIDGHTDFRHPGNSNECASVAGEDLAAAIGEHWPTIADIDGRAPYFAAHRSVHLGCRDGDRYLAEVRTRLGLVVPAREVISTGLVEVGQAAADVACSGYWLHLDVDVLDPVFMPAVDSPDPGGLSPDELVELLSQLAPGAIGAEITVFDPNVDPDGRYASLLVDILAAGITELGTELPNRSSG